MLTVSLHIFPEEKESQLWSLTFYEIQNVHLSKNLIPIRSGGSIPSHGACVYCAAKVASGLPRFLTFLFAFELAGALGSWRGRCVHSIVITKRPSMKARRWTEFSSSAWGQEIETLFGHRMFRSC